jgi:excinuclease ABC subunit C
MVSKIQRLETTIVNSEYDALLLENNLIKEHQPFYNVMLKDDKTYPWICIKNEDFPRIFLTEPKLKTVRNITDLMQSTSCKDSS